MAIVIIIEKATDKTVASIPVSFGGVGEYKPGETELHDLAWTAAVEDKFVRAADRGNYRFELQA